MSESHPAAAQTTIRARRGTYSILARDRRSGDIGVAVQSHWFSVGPIVPWARSGVGAVATQANAEISYGPLALELMQRGASAQEALTELLRQDAEAHSRQVAVIDAGGAIAVHTGEGCIPDAGHAVGSQVSCQANLMSNPTIWGEMLAAYEVSEGRLADRLLATLEAAEAAGGDARGRQSAALLVVPASGRSWETTVSLRVEDDPEPLTELRRLLRVHDAYVLAGEADALTAQQRFDEAGVLYERASELAPENHELLFWSGLGAAQGGRLEAGVEQVRRAAEMHPGWLTVLPRLTADVAPSAAAVADRLGLESA